MAITRCPYCHAIIDENDKYCNNCGTQLLFSEDDEIEEEIPGEKIVDAEVEEKDYTVDEPEDEKRPAPAKDLDSEIGEELAEELREETEEMALDELVAEEARKAGEDDVTEEVILVDEIEAAEAAGKASSKALVEEGPAASKTPEPEASDDEDKDEEDDEDEEAGEEELADELEDEKEDKDVEEEPETKEGTREYAAAAARVPEPPLPPKDEPEVEYVSETPAPDEAATPGEAALRPATFDTKELENLGRTVELSKERVDKFLEVMSEKNPPAAPPPTPPPAPEEAAPAALPIPQTGSLPPWASTMKGAPVFAEDTGSVETRKFRGGEPATPGTEEEVEIFPRRRAADSTIGLPEKVSQSPLPFEATGVEGEAEDEDVAEEAAVEAKVRDLTPERVVLPAGSVRPVREPALAAAPGGEIEAPEEREEPEPRPPFSFSVFFKSKAFDVLFVGLFWLVALWLAASSLGVTLFAILGSMSGPMLLLYAVLILIYFFLFKFFLGETLGDRLFRPRE